MTMTCRRKSPILPTVAVAEVRARRRAAAGTAIVGSLLLHGMLLAAATMVALDRAQPPASEGPEVFIAFDAPGMGDAKPEEASRETSHAPEPQPAQAIAAPAEPEPVMPAEPETIAVAESPARAEPEPQSQAGPARFSTQPVTAAPAANLAARPVAPEQPITEPDKPVVFAGIGAGNAKSVVYVVDCSGPMVTSLPYVLNEVRRSVERLSPSQKFGVVLFRRMSDGGDGCELFTQALAPVTGTMRRSLDEWLDGARPGGRSNPLEGLEAAIAMQPDAVFLLSRSIQRSGGGVWDLGLAQTMRRLDEINPAGSSGRRPVVIQTIQFMEEDPTGTMQAIGRVHGRGKGYSLIAHDEELASK